MEKHPSSKQEDPETRLSLAQGRKPKTFQLPGARGTVDRAEVKNAARYRGWARLVGILILVTFLSL